LEVSITSNVRTGAVASYEAHPVRRLFDAGVPLILNTDDPALFDADLVGEYEIAADRYSFSQENLRQLARNSLAFRF
jgi:adenosine deaminase/aminodeoxyfutalosine deaminase